MISPENLFSDKFFIYNFRVSRDKYGSDNKVSVVDSINYRKPFHKNFKSDNRKIRNFHSKLGNHHSQNENSSKNIEGTKQSNEVPTNEDPADHKTINRHTDRVSDGDTQGTGYREGKVNGGNRDGEHSDKEGSLKNSDNRGQMLHNSHSTNGKKLNLFFVLTLYVGNCLLFDNVFGCLFLKVCCIYNLYTRQFA
jgi:hypothetical protein